MTLGEVKRSALALIEELDIDAEEVVSTDTDIEAKINNVVNIIQNELARIKKIPKYKELMVKEGDTLTFDDLKGENDVYQIKLIRGIDYDFKADGTVIKVLSDGKAEIELYLYPKVIDENTDDSFEMELSQDVLECMVVGVAGMVLMSDISNGYGNIYTNKYENMKQILDMRYNTGSIELEGGYDV